MTLRHLVLPVAFVILGCGSGVDTHPLDPDASPEVDAPSSPAAQHYIIDKLIMPVSETQATALGFDLDGNAVVDNKLGKLISSLDGVQAKNDTAIDRGATLLLVEMQTTGFTSGAATFTVFAGADPQPAPCTGTGDTVCRHHLQGTGTFNVAATSPHDTPLAGSLTGGAFSTDTTTSGRLQIQLGLLTGTPMVLDLVGARVKAASVSATGVMTGVLAGGISRSDIDAKLTPDFVQALNDAIAADCHAGPPTCGCTAGSQGEMAHQLMDNAPDDCTISTAELQASLFGNAFMPDVRIDGSDVLSLGIGFTATPATFTP